ncbi:hypothetical protein BpHYR1_028197 [Brachionus plicatilis]|uniref:Uncharacterized protein n=1 Tax=Brachionus plicatilis TaxID=10195 RepID=A0A3M7Q0P3_BRAPC|nr:hypothetical protein BpHYR1_028197 [Brachionus plicatilis]
MNDSEKYLELINSCDQNDYKSMANKYMNQVSVLMGDDFMAFFDKQEIVPYFDKMMANKIEIKSDGKTIGFGIYLEYSFDDSDKSNTEIYFDGLKIIYKRKIFPQLSFSKFATSDCYLKLSVRIANAFLKSEHIRIFYQNKNKLKEEFLNDKMSQVKIVFEEQKKENSDENDHLAWTDPNIDNKININRIFEKRLKEIRNLNDLEYQKEAEIIIVFMGLLIIHEFAHLLFRWNGNFNSPYNKEPGNALEVLIFNGYIRAIITPNSKWNEKSRYLGIAVEDLSKLRELKYLSYKDFIKRIYHKTLPLKLYFSPVFEKKPEGLNFRAIKQCNQNDENDRTFELPSDWADIETCNVIKCGT